MAVMTWNEKARKTTFTIDERGNLKAENAVVRWENFSGRPNRFGSCQRVFNIVLTPEVYEELSELGWRVKERHEVDADNMPTGEISYMLEVVVSYDHIPPIIDLYTEFDGQKRVRTLEESEIGRLDRKTENNIRVAEWDILAHARKENGKAYLREMNVFQAPQFSTFGDDPKYQGYTRVEDNDEIPFA